MPAASAQRIGKEHLLRGWVVQSAGGLPMSHSCLARLGYLA